MDKLAETTDSEIYRVVNKFTRKVYLKKIIKINGDVYFERKMLAELEILLMTIDSTSLLQLINVEYYPEKFFCTILEYGKGSLMDMALFFREK